MAVFSCVLALLFIIKLLFRKNIRLFEYLCQRYGEEIKRKVRNYENLKKKLTKANLDIDYLVKCKIYNIFPKFLKFKLYRKSLLSSQLYRSWQTKLLNSEINEKKQTTSKLIKEIEHAEVDLKANLTSLDYALCLRYTYNSISSFKQRISNTHRKKLSNLGLHNEIEPCNPDKVVLNYSSCSLSPRLKTLLAFGLEFRLPVHKLNYFKYFLGFEAIASRASKFECSKEKMSEFTHKLHLLAYKYFYNFKPHKIFSAVFKSDDMKLLKNLAKNAKIIVCRPDKGRGVVIVDKETYIDKMTQLISDSSKFENITLSIEKYTRKIEDKVNNFLRKIKDVITLDDKDLKFLHASGSAPGILYGLPKVHKKDFSTKFQFRPIFAAYNNPCFKLAKYLVNVLAPFSTNEYTVTISFSFVSELKQFSNVNSYHMASFDIENLYTNVPLSDFDLCYVLFFSFIN